MNATFHHKLVTSQFKFTVELDDESYTVTIHVHEKGKFIGHEGDIREQIIDYLDENWDKLTNS
jgi:predicted RNA-binding protein YlqC (UPF0109 family)